MVSLQLDKEVKRVTMRTINRSKEISIKHIPIMTPEERRRADQISLMTLRQILPKYINNRRHDFKGIREIKEGIRILEEGIYVIQSQRSK